MGLDNLGWLNLDICISKNPRIKLEDVEMLCARKELQGPKICFAGARGKKSSVQVLQMCYSVAAIVAGEGRYVIKSIAGGDAKVFCSRSSYRGVSIVQGGCASM